jgi:hypothetical protein
MDQCLRYASGYKYQVRAPFQVRLPELADLSRAPIVTDWIELDPDGTLRLKPGYAWDGASGPTYDSKSSMRASAAHDPIYQLIRLGLLPASCREPADKAFHRICEEDGMFAPRAWAWFHLVRIFAKPATDPAAESPDQCAPEGCCAPTPPAPPLEAP